jgi:hypothetical protein
MILADIDLQILRAEILILSPLSNEHLHRLVDQLAELYDFRLKIDKKLRDFEKN